MAININSLSKEEKALCIKLLIDKTLLQTKPDDWKAKNNYFIDLCVPDSLLEVVNNLVPEESVQDFLNAMITTLVTDGISHIAKFEYPGGPSELEGAIAMVLSSKEGVPQ